MGASLLFAYSFTNAVRVVLSPIWLPVPKFAPEAGVELTKGIDESHE